MNNIVDGSDHAGLCKSFVIMSMEFVSNYPNPHCMDQKQRLPSAFGVPK
jgi:hypothetical protein